MPRSGPIGQISSGSGAGLSVQSSPKTLSPRESSACWASVLSRVSSPVSSSTPMAISTTPETAVIDDVAVAQPAERAPRARERERGEQERDAQPERVEEQQDRAVAQRVLRGGGGEDGAERRADARRPGEGEGGAGDQRAARAGARDQRVRAPLAVELGHERREQEEHAEGDDHDARDLVERAAAVLRAPSRGRSRSSRGRRRRR